MSQITVDISDLRVSANPDDLIVTYALGSCIAVIVHDPKRKVGGMIHYMLPLSEIAPEKAKDKPAMFATPASRSSSGRCTGWAATRRTSW